MTRLERDQKRNAERKEKGLCVMCGKENDNKPVTYCKSCAEKRREQKGTRKAYYEHNNRCNVCGGEKMIGSKMCYRCWETNYNAKQRRRSKRTDEEKEAERIKNNAKNRERKRKALENGICYYCLQNKAIEGRRECIECLAKIRKESEQKVQERKVIRENLRAYRLENHLCVKCGEPAKDGYKVCERHYQVSCENSKKRDRKRYNNDWVFRNQKKAPVA